MKKLNIIIIVIAIVFCLQKVNAQVINWNSTDSIKHIVTANFGLDYSVSYGIGCGYKLNTKFPLIINANFSMPSGENLVDDFKTTIGGQIQLLNISNFIGSLAIHGIYRRHETDMVRGTFGYYRSHWFVAAEAGFDKAIVTHFKHSQAFKDEVYADVIDGWYEPATGGNFHYGLQIGVSFGKHDIYFNAGKIMQQDFKTSPIIPIYAKVGYNFKFGKYVITKPTTN